METFFLIVALIIMVAGLVGTILPIIPSVPMVYLGFVIYGIANGWQDYGSTVMIVFGLVTVFVLVLDYVAGAIGAKRFGGSRLGAVGAIVGALIGLIFFNIIGLVVGTFAGAALGELVLGRTMQEAIMSGSGALVGFLAGSLFKFMTSIMMIGAFLWFIIT
jgi:uncharacterized protein YqgC (DUF456 family)